MTSIVSSHLTDQDAEEVLCEAYIQAIAAQARVAVNINRQDYGIDGSFRRIEKVHGRRSEAGIALDFQLKASINWSFDSTSTNVIYKLEAKTYNDLVRYQAPCILILLCLPPIADDWIEQCEDYLLLRKCSYYWKQTDSKATPNSATKTISIRRAQLFTPDSLLRLLTDINNKDQWRKEV